MPKTSEEFEKEFRKDMDDFLYLKAKRIEHELSNPMLFEKVWNDDKKHYDIVIRDHYEYRE